MNVLAQRKWTILAIIAIVPIGFFAKFYTGPAWFWVNNSFSGVFYELFWCFVGFLFFPKSRPFIIALTVLIITCLLEFMQLWHPPFLEIIRQTFLGRTLLGTSFTWSDFPYYFIGCGLGWFLIAWLKKLENNH